MRIFDNPHSKYELLKVIGRGGTSVVYLAKHRTMGTLRAIKCIPKSGAGRECYFAELNILSRINIKGVPQIYDVEEDADNRYIVEEYILGENFTEYIESRKRTVEELIRVICEICDILTELHTAVTSGVIYNDLKPENIIISDKGPYIIDFGNCRFEGMGDSHMVSAGNASPEHIAGGRLTVQTDVYSIGVLIQSIYHVQSALFREYDRQYQDTCMKAEDIIKETISGCMEKEAADRFHTPDMVKRYIVEGLEQMSRNTARYELNARLSNQQAISGVSLVTDLFKRKNILSGVTRESNVYVYGTRRFAGVTHFAVGYTGYLRKAGQKAFYIEHSGTNMMTDLLDKNRADVQYRQGMYQYNNCVMCPDYGDYIVCDEDEDSFGCGINVYDCGLYDEAVCEGDKVIVVIADIKSYGRFDYKDYSKRSNHILYIVNFSDEQGYKRFKHHTGARAIAMPFYDNPFVSNRRVQEFYAEVSKRLWG